MAKYFDRFPLVDYNGVSAKNILAKVDFTQRAKRDIYSNFDYVLTESLYRPDLLSNVNYKSSYYDWLIYLSNGTIDPYHDFFKSQKDFDSFIIGKYGSIENANATIKFYRNNWYIDDSTITSDIYESLSVGVKRYYNPKLNNANQIIGYVRKQEDWVQSTNKIIELTVDTTEGYLIDTVGTQDTTGAKGTICNIDTEKNILTLQHVTGEFAPGFFYYSYVSEIKTVAQNIPSEEEPFWSPVTAYDYEEELNELRKYVNIIKYSYLQDVENLFIEQIKQQ